MERLLKSVEISGSADALMNLMYENIIGDEKCGFFSSLIEMSGADMCIKNLEKEKIEKANNLLGRAAVLSIAVISKHMQTQNSRKSKEFLSVLNSLNQVTDVSYYCILNDYVKMIWYKNSQTAVRKTQCL